MFSYLFNRDETLEALSDAQVVAPAALTVDLHSADHRNSFLYVFDYQTKFGDFPQVRIYITHSITQFSTKAIHNNSKGNLSLMIMPTKKIYKCIIIIIRWSTEGNEEWRRKMIFLISQKNTGCMYFQLWHKYD